MLLNLTPLHAVRACFGCGVSVGYVNVTKISNPDLQAHLVNFLKECAGRNANHFQALVGELSAEEMLVIQRVLSDNKQ